jgi:hypothetical protein
MRTAQQRKKRAEMLKEISDIITNCDNDAEFFTRLLWANEWISNQLLTFESEETENADDENLVRH